MINQTLWSNYIVNLYPLQRLTVSPFRWTQKVAVFVLELGGWAVILAEVDVSKSQKCYHLRMGSQVDLKIKDGDLTWFNIFLKWLIYDLTHQDCDLFYQLWFHILFSYTNPFIDPKIVPTGTVCFVGLLDFSCFFRKNGLVWLVGKYGTPRYSLVCHLGDIHGYTICTHPLSLWIGSNRPQKTQVHQYV